MLSAQSPKFVGGDAPFETSAAEGLRLLLEKAYLPPDFDQETFDAVWRKWPQPLRAQAEQASPAERRRMAYRRYGLIARENDPLERPLQYVVDAHGNWSMNCLACHQGTVAGKMLPGVPNTQLALETLTDEIRLTKLALGKPLTRMDIGSMFMPLGTTNGTTNAVMFGVVLLSYRDADLNVYPDRRPPRLTNHDHDAPAWWHVQGKTRLYADNFAPKTHRAIMQFLLVKQNGPKRFREWENDYRHILAYLNSIEPPPYPFAIDAPLAARGEAIFGNACAECHGTYGERGEYPERIVPLKEIGTDPMRLNALTPKHRRDYGKTWFARYGGDVVKSNPGGYLAPPLDGVWASGPYFHNGSVPTLWHVLNPSSRPIVWRRTDNNGFDRRQVGLTIETFDEVPSAASTRALRREYFDTRIAGKSAAGHTFPDRLSESEKRAVLEYLKTL
jgi:hypothetical protein